jgi:hypothetical protein
MWALQEFLKKFAPHQGTLLDPEFPSNFISKAAVEEVTGVPDKMQLNFFVPHETVCQNEKVRGIARSDRQSIIASTTGWSTFCSAREEDAVYWFP